MYQTRWWKCHEHQLGIRAVCVSPEAAAAVLALLPDPSRLAHTHAAGGVTLAVQARFIALLRLRGRRETDQSAEGCDEEKRPQYGAVKASASQAERQTPAPAEGPPNLRGHSRRYG